MGVGAAKSSPRPPAKVARVVAITRLFRRAQEALGRALPERTERRAPRGPPRARRRRIPRSQPSRLFSQKG